MDTPFRSRLYSLLACIAALALSGGAAAEPPMRAARLAIVSGTVSFSPAGGDDWMRAVVNRPLTNGDRLWVDAGSRAELQVGGAAIRLGANTSMTLLNLDDRIAQVQLSQGTLKVRVRRMGPNQIFEVNTPNLAFSMRRPGEYRIDVDADDDATAVRVKSGRGEAFGDGASYAVNAQQGYRFYGTGLADYDRLGAPRDDELDRWANDRDRRMVGSRSAQFVSSDVVGYEDLDANGIWRRDAEYGNVWTPNRVAASWTPYRDGHWSWVDPWGWTWVDDAPWGYAVSHYGRWANIRGRWSWVPGPQREQAVYAPAQVAFVGGQNFQGASVGGAVAAVLIGWFALAPREVYQPSYTVSRSYFDRINRSNAVVAPASITNIYNTTIVNKTTNVTRVVYANQRVRGGVVAVPAQAFTNSQPVAKASVQVSTENAASAQVANVAPVAPAKQSVHGGAPAASAKPPARERDRRFVARTAPPPPPAAFAAQQKELAAKPGKPIEDAQRKELKPVAPAAAAPAVVVVTTVPAPSAAPPATAPAGKSREERKADGGRDEGRRGDAARSDSAKGEPGRREAAKAEESKAKAAQGDAMKAEAAKAATAKAEAVKADAAKAAAEKAAAGKAAAEKADAAKAAAAKAEAAKVAAAKAGAEKADAVKADAAKAALAKADAAKAATSKGEAAKADAVKAEAAKDAIAKAEAAKAARTGARGQRSDAGKADAGKTDAEKADARAARAKARAARTEAEKADDDKKKAEEEPRRR